MGEMHYTTDCGGEKNMATFVPAWNITVLELNICCDPKELINSFGFVCSCLPEWYGDGKGLARRCPGPFLLWASALASEQGTLQQLAAMDPHYGSGLGEP